ncbi:MAG: hypothetical protein ACP5F1_06780 [Thermoplasmata archaeon]
MQLPDDLYKEILEYINKYRMNSDPRTLFTTKRGRSDYNYLRTIIKDLCKNF